MTYRKDIDALKGIAIIAVVLFHLGLLRSGYLGVDVFFVINGFFLIPKISDELCHNRFRFFPFLEKRIIRLLPLIVVASFICMLVGLVGMLPDNYENLAETVVASNLFSENILSAITTGDYWNVNNDYKPLMHLWYVGVLFEFYLLLPLLLLIICTLIKRITKKIISVDIIQFVLGCILAISLVLYLLPYGSDTHKFYFPYYRLYEFILGGIVGCYLYHTNGKIHNHYSYYQYISFTLLVFVLFSSIILLNPETIGTQIVPIGDRSHQTSGLINEKSTLLIITVSLTAILLRSPFLNNQSGITTCFAYLGRRSYSIFIWHQILLAFYRYFFSKSLSPTFIILYLLIVLLVSELSYRLIETKVVFTRRSFILWIFASFVVIIMALCVYLHAGVVRDVPEQNISFNDVHRGMHAEYVDRVYQYNKDFPTDSKRVNVLVEGVSFGRDFANCLLESNYADSVNLSYISHWDVAFLPRILSADYIFTFRDRDDVPTYVIDNMNDNCHLWGIGTKNYGECNGIVYRKRFSNDYLNTSVSIPSSYVDLNDRWKQSWGNHYIDFIGLAEVSPGVVRVFTPDGKFISQDCEHLTKEGAKWYAGIIPWKTIFTQNTAL